MDLSQVNLGSVPDWLTGIGAILALIFAALAAHFAYRQVGELRAGNMNQRSELEALQVANDQHAAELARLREDRARAQAAKIAAWVEVPTAAVLSEWSKIMNPLDQEIMSPLVRLALISSSCCHIRNGSDLPVFGAQVHLRIDLTNLHPDPSPRVGKTETDHESSNKETTSQPSEYAGSHCSFERAWSRIGPMPLPPGEIEYQIDSEVKLVNLSGEVDATYTIPPDRARARMRAAICFVDCEGQAWCRDIHGRLTMVDQDLNRIILHKSTSDDQWLPAEFSKTIDENLRGWDNPPGSYKGDGTSRE